MNEKWRRLAARNTQSIAGHGIESFRIILALIFAWFALPNYHASPTTPIIGTAFSYATQALSILTVGRLTDSTSYPLLCLWECLIALGLLSGLFWRGTLWLLSLHLILGLLPLVMFRDDLFRVFPAIPTNAGQNVIAYILLLLGGIFIASTYRLAQLEADPRYAEYLNEPPLSREERAAQRRRVQRNLSIGIPTLLIFGIAFSLFWPRYLKWFHARQESAALNEKLSGQLIKKSMPMSSLLHRKITTWVYLPPGYNRSTQRYPVVYVMHGMPGEVRDCFVKGQIQDAAEKLILSHQIKPVIIVGWDGQGPNGPTDVTDFLDKADGSWSMESFIVKELVPYVDQTYRTIPTPESRALIGVSAGGYGAVNLTFKHPDIWKIAASHTGFFDPNDDADNITAMLGPPGPSWDTNNPMKTVRNITSYQNLHVYIDIGQGDELSDEFIKFRSALKAQNIDSVAHIFPGRHTWEYWSTHFYDSLKFANAHFGQPLQLGTPIVN